MKYLILIIFIAAIGCRDDGCTPETTQCNGDVVEICNADDNWEDTIDCTDYGFTCEEGECK